MTNNQTQAASQPSQTPGGSVRKARVWKILEMYFSIVAALATILGAGISYYQAKYNTDSKQMVEILKKQETVLLTMKKVEVPDTMIEKHKVFHLINTLQDKIELYYRLSQILYIEKKLDNQSYTHDELLELAMADIFMIKKMETIASECNQVVGEIISKANDMIIFSNLAKFDGIKKASENFQILAQETILHLKDKKPEEAYRIARRFITSEPTRDLIQARGDYLLSLYDSANALRLEMTIPTEDN